MIECVQSCEYQLLDADLLFVNISMPMGQHGMDALNYLTVPSISTTFTCCGYGACEFLNQASLVANFCGSQSTEVVYTCCIIFFLCQHFSFCNVSVELNLTYLLMMQFYQNLKCKNKMFML